MKIRLEKEMETLLIPLYGRAMMSKKGLFADADAERAVAQIDYDFSTLRIPEKTQILLCLRSALIDDYAKTFLLAHPDSAAVSLGCGLDARARRLAPYSTCWYDLDFPQVLDIKRQLYPQTDRYRLVASSVTDLGWMDKIEAGGAPVLVIAEGLLMYLSEPDVKALFLGLRDRFGDVTLIFDAYSVFTAKQAGRHRSLRKTGARIQWGVRSPEELEAFGAGIVHLKTLYLTDRGAIAHLPAGTRFLYGLAGKFPAAREAHRIFAMRLTAQ
jgi:O-methyltransferase involved in polyketide biosynthesis